MKNIKEYLLHHADILHPERRKISIAFVVIFLVLFGAMHIRLIANTFYVDQNNNIYSTIEGYGDMPLHLTQISKFAFSPAFNLSEPIYYGNTLQYHFLFNMLRGWLLAITGNWSLAVLWPMYLFAIANLVLVFAIFKKILKNNGLTIASLLIFYLGSGTIGWDVFLGKPIKRIIDFGATFPNQNTDFGPVLSMSFIHQQTFVFGTFGFLIFLWLLLKLKENYSKKYLIGAGIILGLLPVMHMHSFVAAVVVLSVEILLHFQKKHFLYLKNLFYTAILGAILALPQIYFLLATKSVLGTNSKFVEFRLGWMVSSGIGSAQFPTGVHSIFSFAYLDFLWINFGIILPIFLFLLAIFIYRYKILEYGEKGRLLLFGLSGAALFGIVELIKFQPWDFDNNKILVYFLFCAAPFMVWMLAYLLRFNRYIQISVLIIVLFFSTLSGVNDTIYRLRIEKSDLNLIFDADARKLSDYVRQHIKDDELILTGTTHRNPIASLAGRQILEGYTGWLWSQGIDYADREKQIKEFYQAPSISNPFLKEYKISHILVDQSVEEDYKITPDKFDKLFKREYEVGKYILYLVDSR